MTDHDGPNGEDQEELAAVFVDVTGDTTVTDRQDREDESGKKVITETDSDSPEGET